MKKICKAAAVSVVLALTIASALSASGCGSADYAMGAQSQTATEVSIVNGMGKSIIGISVKGSGDDSYGDIMAPKDSMLDEANTNVYFELSDSSKRYDLKIDCDDGSVYELHKLKLEDAQDITFKVEGQIGYAVYTSKATGKEVNTLKKEKNLIEAKKKAEEEAIAKAAAKKAAKEAAKKKAAEEAAAKKAAAEEAAARASQEASESSYNRSDSSSGSNNSGSNAASKKDKTSSDNKSETNTKKDTSSNKGNSDSSSEKDNSSSESKPSNPSPQKDDPSCTDDILLK